MKRELYVAIYNALSDQIKRSEMIEQQNIKTLCNSLMEDRPYYANEIVNSHKALEYDRRMLESFEAEFEEPAE